MKCLKSHTILTGGVEVLAGAALSIIGVLEVTDLNTLFGAKTAAAILLGSGVLKVILRYTTTKPVKDL